MHPILHLGVTLIVAVYAWNSGSSLHILGLIFVLGFFIDLDHFLTYWLAKRNFSLNPVTIYLWNRQTFKTKKLDLNEYLFFFHETEIIVLITAVLMIVSEPIPLLAYLLHQGMDWIHRQIMKYNNLFLYKYVLRQRQMRAS
jgi:hypothetical protein